MEKVSDNSLQLGVVETADNSLQLGMVETADNSLISLCLNGPPSKAKELTCTCDNWVNWEGRCVCVCGGGPIAQCVVVVNC